jgi:release factor glutamine methyltransferase
MAKTAHPTPLDLARVAAGYLADRGVESPRLDAELLLAHVLAVPRIRLYLDFDKPLSPSEVDAYREAVRRRGRREPVAHVTGVREFWSLEFRVDSRVLVPRPETETLVEACLARMGDGGRFLEVGVGSGAVASALLTERPGWVGVGVDWSPGALEVARLNLEHLGFGGRLELRAGDLFGPVVGERFDLIVSNPPYIPTEEIGRLEPEVARYEPREALDGGADGLAVIRKIAAEAPLHLERGGFAAVEFGVGQEREVARIFVAENAYGDVDIVRDPAGRPRVAVAAKS